MTAPADVLRLAGYEVGTVETPNNKTEYNRWYGGASFDGQPWCATFVSWVFHKAGLPLPASTAKGFAYTPSGAAWFQKQGRWHNTQPRAGDVVFFDWPGDGVNRISHVGIVDSVNPNGSVNTIEGNTQPGTAGNQSDGGAVHRRVRSTGIVGYGRPAYSGHPQGDDVTPEQNQWLSNVENRTKNAEGALQALQAGVADLKAAVAGIATGGVDMDALAEKVADELAARLKDG